MENKNIENKLNNKTLLYVLTMDFFKRLNKEGTITVDELNKINEDLKEKYRPLFDVLVLDYKAALSD